MFVYIAGIPLSEYIRRRRMSLAAVDLQTGTEKIIDIGMKYGYSSPTAFNRAFQSVHGIAPSLAKKRGSTHEILSPHQLQNNHKRSRGIELSNRGKNSLSYCEEYLIHWIRK